MESVRTWRDRTARRLRATAALALGLVLVWRLVAAPVALGAAEGERVPICMGGTIVHVVIDRDPGTPATPAEAEPCPYFGMSPGMITPAPAATPRPVAGPVRAGRARGAAEPLPRPAAGYAPRAPPGRA